MLSLISVASAIALSIVALQTGSLDMGWGASTALGGTLRIGFSFSLGIVLYRLLAQGKLKTRKIHPLALLALLTLILLTPFGNPNIYYDIACTLLAFPLFVIFACQSETPKALTGLFAKLGTLSYALYILHNPLMSWVGGVWKVLTHQDLAERTALSAPILLTAIILGSYITAIYIDEPLRRALQKRLFPKP